MVKDLNKRLKYIALPLLLVLVGCSTAPEKQFQDPYEGFNRKVYSFNEGFDDFILEPVSRGYKFVTPDPVEKGVSNFFSNLFYPRVFLSALLQGKPGEAVEGLSRFVMNSTFGLAGLIDVATDMGLEKKNNDFGQTFAQWGFGSGPYLVLPIVGSYTARHGFGELAATPTSPLFHIEDNTTQLALTGGLVIDRSAQLLEEREFVTGDKYLFQRDAYLQKRRFLVEGPQAPADDPFLAEFE